MELSVPDGAGAPGAQGMALIPRERHWGGVCPWAGAFDPGPAGQRAQTASCGAVGAARLCPSCAVLTPPPVTEVSRVAPLQVMAPAGCNSYYGPSPLLEPRSPLGDGAERPGCQAVVGGVQGARAGPAPQGGEGEWYGGTSGGVLFNPLQTGQTQPGAQWLDYIPPEARHW